MTIKTHIWNQITANAKGVVPSSEFHTWLSKGTLKEITEHQAIIEVPNKYIAHWLQDNCSDHIQMIFRKSLNIFPQIRFISVDSSESEEISRATGEQSKPAGPAHGIDPQITFNDFVTANSNRLAYSSAVAVANHPGSAYNPLYLFGGFGLGKTHILNGIGNLVLERDHAADITYLSADQLVDRFLSSSIPEATPRFWEADGGPDFLLLDDIHLVTRHQKFQTDLLALCRTFLDASKQLVLSAAYPPARIPNLLPQLRSRLEWGLIAEIHRPSQRTKANIIQKMGNKQKILLPKDVAFFLAGTADDLNMLRDYVRRLKALSDGNQTPIDMAAARSVVQPNPPSPHTDIHQIQDVTAKYFGISVEDLLSDKRHRAVSYPRQMAMYLCHKLTSASLKEIGQAFGNKHHSTIIYSQQRIEKDQGKNRHTSNDIDKIQNMLL